MKNGIDLSLGQRLGIGLALLLAILGGLLASMYYWQLRSAAAERAFTGRIAPLVSAADELERAVLRVAIDARAVLIGPDADRARRYEATAEKARSALRRLGELPREADGEALYRSVLPGIERYLDDASRLVEQRGAGVEQRGRAEAALASSRESVMSGLQEFTDLQQVKARNALASIEDAREEALRGLAAAALLAMVLFSVSAVVMARAILRPARALLHGAQALQEGDWQPALAWAPGPGESRTPRDEMVRLAHAFAAAAGALERRDRRLRVDREIADATASSLLRETVASSALQAVCDHLNAEIGVLYWQDEGSSELKPLATRALDAGAAIVAVGEGIPGRAAREMRTVVARDIPRDSPFSVKLGYDAAPPRTVAAVPIAFRGELLGVLVVGSLRELDAGSIGFLDEIALQLGIGLQNVRTHEHVQRLLAEVGGKNQQIQAQNEELQAQSEEIQAQNEELQAQNEELQAQGEEIQAQNEQLKQQTENLREHAASLAEADRRKGEFLGVLAHELRNPMAAISNSLYALLNAGNSEQRSRAQDIIGRQTRFLSRLVDDLLDVTRISSGKVRLHKEVFDFADVVSECSEDYRGAADKAGVSLEIDVGSAPVRINGDRTRLCQIVGNLLDNAIKFANGGREVKVTLVARDGKAELRVKDRGVGIESDMLLRLFQPFSQADSSLARRKSGLGLGLALAKALVDLHEGEIEAHSDGPGKGAEFTVRLPLAAVQADDRASVHSRPEPRPGSGRRVLIIEDNPDAALSLRDAMKIGGHEVRVAYDAAEGIEIARDFHPDVLLCDIGLPTMDGYQVARRFRSDERLRSTFMIAVTGYASPEDRDRAVRAGFDRHLGKPPDIDSLNRLLAELQTSRPG